ncbi:hypothetical protein BT69DRAFT_12574 [Atractiella rhizophila]|nr:hypothetical protein BT69DRAFT_12574 [Atractiella rhizophila]
MVGLAGGKGKEREKRYAWEEWRGRSFGRLKRMGEEESVRLLDSKGKKKDVSYSLGRVETVLAILNFFRNVTTAEDVGRFCASLPRFAELLLRPCILEANFTAKRAKAGGRRSRSRSESVGSPDDSEGRGVHLLVCGVGCRVDDDKWLGSRCRGGTFELVFGLDERVG